MLWSEQWIWDAGCYFSIWSTIGNRYRRLCCGTSMSNRAKRCGGHSLPFMQLPGPSFTVEASLWICRSCWASNRFTTTSTDYCRRWHSNRVIWCGSMDMSDILHLWDWPSFCGPPIYSGSYVNTTHTQVNSNSSHRLFHSLDRLVLAVLWTTFMYVAWNTDKTDVQYQRYQFERKKHELRYSKTHWNRVPKSNQIPHYFNFNGLLKWHPNSILVPHETHKKKTKSKLTL